MNMNRFLIPASAALAMAMATPALAYYVPNDDVDVSARTTTSVDVGSNTGTNPTVSTGVSGNATVGTATRPTLTGTLGHSISASVRPDMLDQTAVGARIAALSNVLVRLNASHQIPNEVAARIKASVQAQIDRLQAVPVGPNDATTQNSDSIGVAYHGYLVAMPKAWITVTANHVLATAGMMENFSVKLGTRIDASADAGADVSSLRTMLATMKAKVADAKVQANAALSIVADVDENSANASADASVTTSLRSAQAKIAAARQDLVAAFQDAQNIILGVHGSASASADVNASANSNSSY